jgi:hypothetical protein
MVVVNVDIFPSHFWNSAKETVIAGASCPVKSNEETIRIVVALADIIAPRYHEFRVVALPRSARNLEGLLAQRGDQWKAA